MNGVYISENFKVTYKTNPISGHTWAEHGRTTSYAIIGPYGKVATARSIERAEIAKQEWQEFYDKFFPQGTGTKE